MATKTSTSKKRSFADAAKVSGAFKTELFTKSGTLASDARSYIPTGNIIIDAALGTGGIPTGKITEVNGKPHAGKTTLTYLIAKEAQKLGGYAGVYDVENSMNTAYITKLGLQDEGNFFRFSPGEDERWTVESVFIDMVARIKTFNEMFPEEPGVFIVDSLGAMRDKDSAEKGIEAEKVKPGATAKAMANVMRELPEQLAKSNIAVIIINHSYQGIGAFASVKSYGGDALGYAKQVGLYLKTTTRLDSNNPELGYHVNLTIQKNKTADSSYKTVEVALVKNAGFDNYFSAFKELQKDCITKTSNGRYTLTDELLGELKFTKGFLGLKSLCEENPELNERVLAKLKAKVAPSVV